MQKHRTEPLCSLTFAIRHDLCDQATVMMQETKRATEAEKRVLTIQKKLDAEERKDARLERKIQTLNRSNADDATLISKADLAKFLSEVVAKDGSGGV